MVLSNTVRIPFHVSKAISFIIKIHAMVHNMRSWSPFCFLFLVIKFLGLKGVDSLQAYVDRFKEQLPDNESKAQGS